MQRRRAPCSSVANGFLLQELLVFMALSVSFTMMVTLLVVREKKALRALQRREQRSLHEVLILQLVLADIARSHSSATDESGVLSCTFVIEGTQHVVRWSSQRGDLMRRMYKNGKFSQTHCYGDVLRCLKATTVTDKVISLSYDGDVPIQVVIGSRQ